MRFLALFPMLLLLLACGNGGSSNAASAQPATKLENPNIRLAIEGVSPQGALLVGQYMEQQFRADSAEVEGNVAVFKRDTPYEPGHYYAYYPNGTSVQMIIDADQTFTLTASSSDLVGTMQVDGSQDNALLYQALAFENNQQGEFRRIGDALRATQVGTDAYNQLQDERLKLVDQRQAFLQSLYAQAPNSLFTSFKRAGQNPQLRDIRKADGTLDEPAQVTGFRYDFWKEVDFSDKRLLRTPVVINKLKRYVKELTPQNADSIIAASKFLVDQTLEHPEFFQVFANWITLEYEPGKSTVMDAEAIHVYMIQNYFTRERAFWSDSMTVWGLQDRADQMAHSLVGQAGPDVTVPGIDGQPKRLYDLKKPYIAVFMFNPECEHCIEQTPKLMSAYQTLKGDLDVYAIALDTEAEKWKSFVQRYGMGAFTNVYDPTNRSIFKTYYVDNTPELYLLGPDRKIVAKNLKVEQLAEAIALHKRRNG